MLTWGTTRRRCGTGSVLPAAAADAYEGSGGIRVAGGRSLFVPRRHHCRCPRGSPGTLGVVTFLERELTARGIHLNLGNGPDRTPCPRRKRSLLAKVRVHIADEGGIKVVGVPVGIDEFAIESAMGMVRDRGGGTTRADAATSAG